MDWIACAERLPEVRASELEGSESSDEVLAYDALHEWMDIRRLERIRRADGWSVPGWSNVDRGDVDTFRITHWMPLPAPPVPALTP